VYKRWDGSTASVVQWQREVSVIGRHADAAGPEIDGGSAREARGHSTPPRRPAAAGAPSFNPAHGPSLFHLVFIVVRRNNWWSMGSKVPWKKKV